MTKLELNQKVVEYHNVLVDGETSEDEIPKLSVVYNEDPRVAEDSEARWVVTISRAAFEQLLKDAGWE